MVWFKVDDNLAFHRKTLRAGNAAIGMWVRAGSEISQQLTDGFVPDALVTLLGGHGLARKLVSAELWHRVEGGYQFHEWNAHGRQPTRASVEADRQASAERKERWKERRKNTVQNGDGTAAERRSERVPNGDGTPTHARAATRPDPTRPVKEKERELTVIPNLTDQLLEEHAAAYQTRPSSSVLTAVRRHIDNLLDEGSTPALIRAALAKMRARKLAPRLLPELVAEVTPTNGHQPTTPEDIAKLSEGQLLNLGQYGTIHGPSA